MAEANACVSLDLLEEYRAVPDALRANGKITALQFQALVAGIAIFVAEARLVEPTKSIRVCRDPKDDMVLECCLAAKATTLVTGDRDLLEVDLSAVTGLRRLRIMSPRAFVDSMR